MGATRAEPGHHRVVLKSATARGARAIACHLLRCLRLCSATGCAAGRRATESVREKAQEFQNRSKTIAVAGGETHQTTTSADQTLTTNQGTPISDNQNSLKSGARGPTLLEDFVLREKITHFDHERIPERIVHARGSGAHGYFQPHQDRWRRLTKAAFLQDPGKKTPVFARFSTVAGGAGSVDTPRDVRGFAVKFYTEEGNFDLVGNNIPVFFIQDAMKFPDLVHSVKMEPDRGFPQAASAHDTFWDFVSLMPESMHMLMWAMSDRTIPRSLRMIEGFGVHTFRLVNAKGESTFVKFHWRPTLGAASTLWDEAVKIDGADPDFHRRDLWEAIDARRLPGMEAQHPGVRPGDGRQARLRHPRSDQAHPRGDHAADADRPAWCSNRNPINFFAETEQVAFHPGHHRARHRLHERSAAAGPPVLLSRHPAHPARRAQLPRDPDQPADLPDAQLPARRPHAHEVPPGRVNYEPNSLDPDSPRENPARGFASFPDPECRAEAAHSGRRSFADHYSQARLFWRSMTAPEQGHIVSAFTFELSKVETLAIRQRMLGHLDLIEPELGKRVATAMGMDGQAEKITPAVRAARRPAAVAGAQHHRQGAGHREGPLHGRPGDRRQRRQAVKRLQAALKKEGAKLKLVAPKIGKLKGNGLLPDMTVEGGPSVLFDGVVLLPSAGAQALLGMAAAINWLRDAFGHLKAIGFNEAALAVVRQGRRQARRQAGRRLLQTAADLTPSSPPPRSIKSGIGRSW